MGQFIFRYSCSRLNGNTSVCLNPLQKGGDPCEGSVHPDLTAQGGAEAGDSNLPVLAVLIEVLQGTARVALERQTFRRRVKLRYCHTLHVEVPSLPEMQMFLWSTLMGNWRAQAVLVIVSTVASLSTGEIPSAESLGLPQPEICMSR